CSCNSKLPVDRFHIANQNKDGRVVYCIDCVTMRYLSNSEPAKQSALRYKARKRQAFIQDIDKDLIYDIYNGCCYLCGFELEDGWHLDHIQPLVLGGKHSYANVAPACSYCNLTKNKTTLV